MDARRARAPHRRIAAAVYVDISCPIWLNKACSPLILLGIPGPPPGLGQQGMQLSHRDVRSQLLSRWRFLAYQVRQEHACVALCWPQTAPQTRTVVRRTRRPPRLVLSASRDSMQEEMYTAKTPVKVVLRDGTELTGKFWTADCDTARVFTYVTSVRPAPALVPPPLCRATSPPLRQARHPFTAPRLTSPMSGRWTRRSRSRPRTSRRSISWGWTTLPGPRT